MELWEHLEELIQCTDKRFLESTKRTIKASSNGPPLLTQTRSQSYTHTHTPLGCRGKGHIRWTKGTKSISLHCVILQHFRLTLQAQGLAFFSTRVPYTHPHACFSVRVSDPIGYRPWGMRCILWNTMSMSGSVSLASDKLLYNTSCVAGRDNRCAACGSLIIVAAYHTSTYSME